MDRPVILLDGDTVAFIAAAAVQTNVEDEHGFVTPVASVREGEVVVDNLISSLVLGLGSSREHLKVYLSDKRNWRWEDVDPSYKNNRKDTVRPLVLTRLKDYLVEQYGAWRWPRLEADDVLGLMATEWWQCEICDVAGGWEDCTHCALTGRSHAWRPQRIVVGRDKDFKTIPGRHHTIGDKDGDGKPVIREVSPAAADAFFYAQVLAGDRVDGFDGCPGIGMTRAERIVAEPVRLYPVKGVITRGKNKGQETTKWYAEPCDSMWECIVSHYEKAGQGEREALVSARLARILRWGEYNFETGDVKLWRP